MPTPCFGPSPTVSPDGRWLATSGLQGPVQLRSLAGPPETNTLTLSGRITPLAFSPDQRFLVAANEEGLVKVWEMPTRRELTFQTNATLAPSAPHEFFRILHLGQ